MRIAIDARAAAEEQAGRGTMVRELLLALDELNADHSYELLARRRWQGPLSERFSWRLSRLADPWWNVRAGMGAHRYSDAFLSTNSYLTVWFTRVPTVMTVCDMVAFDDALRPRRRSRAIERATLPRAVRRAAAITAISQATADELAGRFPGAATKTTVTPLAADRRFATQDGTSVAEVRGRYGIERPYVLAVGTLEPRKNLPRLIEAFAALPAQARDARELVLVGRLGWEAGEIRSAIGRYRGLVRELGHVPDADLPALYRGAELFAYPSLHEGFGLPILEAMAAGTAVLTSSTSSMPEVAGDAALYCDPRDAGSIRDGLLRGLTDAGLRRDLEEAGRRRADSFSWERHARETLEVIERVAGTGA